MSRQSSHLTVYKPTVLLLGIQAPYNRAPSIESYFEEFRALVKTNEVEADHELYLKLRSIDPSFFLTKGKMAEVRELCKKHNVDHIILSESLTGLQEKNLRDMLECRVFDRTRLILEIFEKHAHSIEGKVQVAIAMLRHQKTRLTGKGIHLSQQSGRIGTRGPGETAKEKETRHIEQTMLQLRKQLEKTERARATQRKQRLASNTPQLSLVGYTNAGKSTILNALTKSDVIAQDKLFATLDTTTRELYLDGHKKGLISDTVGFIQQLPPRLIEAFKSTLSELRFADLLLHVVDASDPNWQAHIKVVNTILHELGLDKPMLYVFNKVDRIPEDQLNIHAFEAYAPHVITSATQQGGLDTLKQFLAEWRPSTRQ